MVYVLNESQLAVKIKKCKRCPGEICSLEKFASYALVAIDTLKDLKFS